MAIGDLTAEEQSWAALLAAYEFLLNTNPPAGMRERTLAEVREAIKRMQEARNG